MEYLMSHLEPSLLWKYFEELSAIPRGSKVEAEAARWVADQGRALGLETEQDAVGNVLIRKPATPGREDHPCTCLQAHVDMVCEKNEGTDHDFLKDGIKLRIDGDLLKATGTTLGADNGIGVAAGLAVLASKNLQHGPIEVLVTIDEETGLTGANNLQPNWLKSKFLLNLDSEEEGYLTIGCAGGIDTIASRRMSLQAPRGNAGLRLRVTGLKGGHSGIDIHAGRGNAIRTLAQVLRAAQDQFGAELSSIKGGNKRNAIPREASAILVLDASKTEALKQLVASCEKDLQDALGANDPGVCLSLEAAELPELVYRPADALALVSLLLALPHGVEAMSPDIAGLVQTSTNLGVIQDKDGLVEVNLLTRSSIDSSKYMLTDRISAVCELAGFQAQLVGGYPGWKPVPTASLVQTVNDVQKELFGKDMHIMAIHAGLECGIIGEKYPGMEMVSIGPDMWDVHTPEEKLSIPSVGNFWKLLTAILEKI